MRKEIGRKKKGERGGKEGVKRSSLGSTTWKKEGEEESPSTSLETKAIRESSYLRLNDFIQAWTAVDSPERVCMCTAI